MKSSSQDCARAGIRKIIRLRWKPQASLVAARGMEGQGCRPTKSLRRGSRIQRTQTEPRREPSSQRSRVGASSVHSFAQERGVGRRPPHCHHVLLPRGAPACAREVPRARLDQNSCLVDALEPAFQAARLDSPPWKCISVFSAETHLFGYVCCF